MYDTPKKSIWMRMLSSTALIFWCLFLFGAGTLKYIVDHNPMFGSIIRNKIWAQKPEDVFRNNSVTILLLGCDKDYYYRGTQTLNTAARSDMMMLLRLDFEEKRATGVSIPRDILVEMPGFKRSRINAFHALGRDEHGKPSETIGRDLAKKAVEYCFNVNIDKVIEINFDKFQDLVDTVGGVDVFVDKRMKYTDTSQHLFIDLEPGRRHLDGYNAMCFVRYRKNQSGHGESDDNRQNRQKQLIYAIKDQLVHNPGRIPAAIEDAHNTLAGDITTDEIAVIANYLMDIGNDNVKMSIIPTQELKVEDGYNKYDLTFDRKKTIELLRELKFIDTDTTTYNYDQ